MRGQQGAKCNNEFAKIVFTEKKKPKRKKKTHSQLSHDAKNQEVPHYMTFNIITVMKHQTHSV